MQSVGQILRQTREDQGRTLEDIYSITRISPRALEAIESDDLGSMSSAFFYKSFVRQFCHALGLPFEDLEPNVRSTAERIPQPLMPGEYGGAAPRVPALRPKRKGTSKLLFALYSAFYALRSEVRKQVLLALVPDLPAMYNLFKPTVGKRVSSEELAERVGLRVKQLKVLVEQHGARLIMIVPPIPRPGEEYQDGLRAAEQAAGVAIAAPMTIDYVPRADFEDDVHLRPAGAKLFTESLREPFLQALGGGR